VNVGVCDARRGFVLHLVYFHENDNIGHAIELLIIYQQLTGNYILFLFSLKFTFTKTRTGREYNSQSVRRAFLKVDFH